MAEPQPLDYAGPSRARKRVLGPRAGFLLLLVVSPFACVGGGELGRYFILRPQPIWRMEAVCLALIFFGVLAFFCGLYFILRRPPL